MPDNQQQDRVIWRRDLQAMAGVTSETIRRWMNSGKLPEPDVNCNDEDGES